MVGLVLVATASTMSVVAFDAIAESAPSGARDLVLFGHTIAEPGSPAGPWILIGLAVIAMLAWAAALARSHGRRLESRLDAELGSRRDLSSRRSPDRRAGADARHTGRIRHSREMSE